MQIKDCGTPQTKLNLQVCDSEYFRTFLDHIKS